MRSLRAGAALSKLKPTQATPEVAAWLAMRRDCCGEEKSCSHTPRRLGCYVPCTKPECRALYERCKRVGKAGRGGKREGAGRKKTTGKTVKTLSCTADAQSYDQVVILATERGQSVSEWVLAAVKRHAAMQFMGSM